MNIEKLFSHDLPAGAMALIGVILLFVVIKTGKLVIRLILLAITVGLFAAAYWWYFVR